MKQEYFKYIGTTTNSPKIFMEATVSDILKVVKQSLHKNEKYLTVLDAGSGFGDYSIEFAKRVKEVVGVEPYKKGYASSLQKSRKIKNLHFINDVIENVKLHKQFDVAVSLTTLEHMPFPEKSFEKIFSLLKPKGVLYITAPNKLWPFESHYGLPFLSLLPIPIANMYLRLFGYKSSYQDCSYSKTYFEVRKLLDKFPCTYKFITPDPNAPYLGCGKKHNLTFLKIAIKMINMFPFLWIFSKGFIIVAIKNK